MSLDSISLSPGTNRVAFVPVLLLVGAAMISGAFAAGARTAAQNGHGRDARPIHIGAETVMTNTGGASDEHPAHDLRLLSQSLHRGCRNSRDQHIVLEEETARYLYGLAVRAERAEKMADHSVE